MSYQVEVTDTFGREANYGWVRRYLIDAPTAPYRSAAYRRDLVKRAKAAAGWTGERCETHDMGDGYELRPRRMLQVMFITSWDSVMDDHFSGEDLRAKAEG